MAAGERTRDTEFIGQAFADLIEWQQEFPLKVEGAKTLPYTAVLQESDPVRRTLVVKLFRPLPPALAMGAWFDLVFATRDRRYEGRISLVDRAGYLRYQFGWPESLLSSDRRLWKRYPFRPREDVYVTAQDCELPYHGLTGPLTSLSQGGFSFRLDRMLRLEDGLLIRPRANFFDQGRALSPIRIHGLTREESFEARGKIVRTQEGDSEIHLAVQFNELGEKESKLLSRILAVREQQTGRGTGGAIGAGRRESSGYHSPGAGEAEADAAVPAVDEAAPEAAGDGEAAEPLAAQPAALAGMEPLLRLDRRSAKLLLVAQDEQDRVAIIRLLQAAGFWRLEAAADLAEARAAWDQAVDIPFRLLLVDLEDSRREGLEPVGAVRRMEQLLGAFDGLPVAYLTQAPDPMLELLGQPGLSAVAWEGADPAQWTKVLDRLLQFSPG